MNVPRSDHTPSAGLPAPDDDQLEAWITARFETRNVVFDHASFRADLRLPADAERLLDESRFDADEWMPYWAELWPSARALTRHLLDTPPPERAAGAAVEIGCGVGLPSLALHALGAAVTATDHTSDALVFTRFNALRLGRGPIRTALLDWRDTDPGRRADLVIAADVLYESRAVEPLIALLPRLLHRGGRCLLADPGRRWLDEFLRRADRAGLRPRTIEERTERQDGARGPVPIRVRIVELSSG